MVLVSVGLLHLLSVLPGTATAAPVLAQETCDPAFDLVVPTEVLRARGKTGLTVLTNVVAESNRLEFVLRPDSCLVVTRIAGKQVAVAQGEAGRAMGDVVIKRRPGKVAVAYGAATVVRATTEAPDGGQWGLAEGSAEEIGTLTYQPIGDVVFTDDFMRGADEQSAWTDAAGAWSVKALDSAQYSANAFSLLGRGEGRRAALTVTGDWFWEDYTVGVSVRPSPGAEGFGVGLGYQAGPNVHLLRWVAQPGGGAVQIVRVAHGREQVLTEAPLAFRPDEWHRLTISGVEGKLVGEIDGARVVAAEDPTLAHGQAALWVLGETPVYFDDVEVRTGPIRERPPTVLAHAKEAAEPAAAQFIKDHYMEGWADESDQWVAASGPSIWHAGYFWGDVEVAWETSPGALAAPVALHLGVPVAAAAADPPPSVEPGYHLRLSPEAGRLAVALAKGSETRASAAVDLPTDTARVVFRKTGGRLAALIGDRVIASFEDSDPLPGGKVGLSEAGATAQAAQLSITSRNVLDSTFRSAPVEWRIGGGSWGVQSRWACTPRWSWFGGRSAGLAAIWTRDRFAGDVIADFFASIPMDSPFAPFYQHPSNICVTLCSDGQTLGTGYSLIVGGWENRETAIFRRGEVVARTPAFRLPDIIDSFGGTLTPNAATDLHKSWRHIRAERMGKSVRLLVDGQLALSYEDPEPLPGGPVCIWTLDNGIMVARERVYYEGTEDRGQGTGTAGTATAGTGNGQRAIGNEGGQAKAVAGLVATEPGSVSVSREAGGGGAPAGCVLVTNVAAGGTFSASAVEARGVDLRRKPVLSLDYAVPGEARVDIYLVVAGQRYRLRLAGPAEGANGIEEIGSVPAATADGKWHHAEVDLLERMGPLFPAGAPVVLEDLQFANQVQREYLSVGIGGNGAGVSYRLANLSLRPAREQDPATETGGAGETPAAPALVRCDFERDLGCFRPWGVDAGAQLRRAHTPVAGNERGGGWCLEVRNGQLGGLFGLEVGCVQFEASRYPRIAFDYRVPDTLRVDLIVDVAGERRQVKFTDNDATWPVIGSIGALADGQWHHAQIDLGAVLRAAFPGRRSLPVTRLAFASAGWPGNRRGTTYWLDNFEILPATPAAAGDQTPPVLRDPSPGPGEAAATRQVSVTVTDAGSGVSPADLRLKVGAETYTLADEALRFDEASGRLTFTAPGSAPLGKNGDPVACELCARDLAGNDAAPLSWTWRLDTRRDDRPPPAPVVSTFPSEALFADTFEEGKGGWGDFFSCQVLRRAVGGATGPGCLELTELGVERPGLALIRDLPADWMRFPRLRFRYRLQGTVGASVVLVGTTFDGATDYWTPLATLPTRSEEWQTASVDLVAALKAANPALSMHRLFLSVTIPQPGGALLIDDAVMYSPAGTGARFVWGEPAEASGVTGYSWKLDHEDDTVPAEVVSGDQREVAFEGLGPGHWCFHVRARDGAGHWGAASHVPFDVEAAREK